MRVGRRHISIHEGGQVGWKGCRAPCSPVPNLKPPLRDCADTLFSLSLNAGVTFFGRQRAHTSQQCQTHGCLQGTGQLPAGAQQDSPQSQGTPRDKEEDIPAAGTVGAM